MNVRGQVLLALWDVFKREGVEIPFPQRDVNFKMPLAVAIDGKAGYGAAAVP